MKAIKDCKYLLPCGICDRTGEMCSQYKEVKVEPKKQVLNEETKSNKIEDDEYKDLLKKYLNDSPQAMKPYEIHYDKWLTPNYSCCENCSNNPKNGGSGICNCALPYMTTTGSYPGTKITYTTNTSNTSDNWTTTCTSNCEDDGYITVHPTPYDGPQYINSTNIIKG